MTVRSISRSPVQMVDGPPGTRREEAPSTGTSIGPTTPPCSPSGNKRTYHAIKQIGEGGQGIIYLCHDDTGRKCVLKLPKSSHGKKAVSLEAKHLKTLCKVSGVIKLYGQTPEGWPIMQYAPGGSLQNALKTQKTPSETKFKCSGQHSSEEAGEWGSQHPVLLPDGEWIALDSFEEGESAQSAPQSAPSVEGAGSLNKPQPLSPQRIKTICASLVRTMICFAALGIIHRDIKPSNILLDETGKPLIADVALATTEAACDKKMCGTHTTMSPEIIKGEQATCASDVWSLGCTIFEIMTGEPLLGNEPRLCYMYLLSKNTDFSLNAITDPQAKDLLSKMLIYNPTTRLSMAKVAQHPYITGKSPSGTRPSPPP